MLWSDQTVVVTLPGEVDITNADAIREELLSVINQGAEIMIADMSKTRFCDSAGVSTLVRAFRRATSSGTKMRLAVGGLAVERVLTLTGVDRLIEVYPSVGAALGSPVSSSSADTSNSSGRSPGTTNGGG
ncbi:MAG TPA: STAS domain-containing protein [Streptosporangiaceae bacterium]